MDVKTPADIILAEAYREIEWAQWVGRVVAWRGAYFIRNRPHYCSICERLRYCKRLHGNRMIQDMILRGETCPDVWTVWNKILAGDTRHGTV